MARRTRSNAHYVRSVLRQVWAHPSNRGRRGRALAGAVAWQAAKRLRPEPREVPFFGWRLRCHPASGSASNVIYFTELYDPEEMTFMRRYLRPGDRFVDVGANIGTYSLLARRLVGPGGQVVAFEPDPGSAARLRENLGLNGITNVEVHEAAVGERPGTAQFLVDFDVSNRIVADGEPTMATRPVDVAALDPVLGDRPVAMAKLDVEGHEVAALRGAADRLARADPPVWQVEVLDHQLARAGTSREELLGILDAAGFRLADFDPARGLRFLGPDERPRGNVWAVHGDAEDAVRDRLAGRAP